MANRIKSRAKAAQARKVQKGKVDKYTNEADTGIRMVEQSGTLADSKRRIIEKAKKERMAQKEKEQKNG